jgi:hypothetical protein
MNGLWTNKLDEIERNPKVIPCFFHQGHSWNSKFNGW